MLRRLAGAWHVLMGQRLVPFQIQAEWVSYQRVFGQQLEQMSSYLARQAKAETKRLARIQQDLTPAAAASNALSDDRDARKAALRTKIAGGIVPQAPSSKEESS